MAIIKHKTKSGIIYCYESTPKWDADHKQARPEKKYLGRWDEETQSIIPTTGKRGRKKKEGTTMPENSQPEVASIQEYRNRLEAVQLELTDARKEIARLSEINDMYARAISAVRDVLAYVK